MKIQINNLSKVQLISLCVFSLILMNSNNCKAEDINWKSTIAPHLFLQGYNDSDTHNSTINIGAYMSYEYLDSDKLILGYNNTNTFLNNNAKISENTFHFSAQHNVFLDILPGKLTFRLDTYFGRSTLEYKILNPPGSIGAGGMGKSGKITGGGSATVEESSDMTSYQPQLSYINFAKTFYADLGYAYSEYSGTSKTEVKQVTPTIGFGWNDSYDWLQFRFYRIDINDSASSNSKNKFESLETKYTHWTRNSDNTDIEYVRFSVLTGERVFAIDSDARVNYSNSDMQRGSIETSVQWKVSNTGKILALVNYSRYINQVSLDNYNSVLLYINYQNQW